MKETIDAILKRVATGMSTVKDAETLHQLLVKYQLA